MLPGIPAALFMAVTQTLFKAGSARDRAAERMIAGPNLALRLRWFLASAGKIAAEKITRAAARFVRLSGSERVQGDDMPVMAIRRRALKESIF